MERFGMSYDSFVDFCILSGCDYTEPIPQIGPITSYNLIKKHGNIEEILKTMQKEYPKFNYKIARKIFKEFDYEIPEHFKIIQTDKETLLDFLNKHNFKDNVICKFINILN
jgi:flap endonuclease-1